MVLEIVFKVAPTILLAGFNLRIMVVYRRSCERRRRMTLSRTTSNDEDSRTFAEEKRLVLLLGSTSILFLVCVSPMVILNVTLRESNLSHYPYQVIVSSIILPFLIEIFQPIFIFQNIYIIILRLLFFIIRSRNKIII